MMDMSICDMSSCSSSVGSSGGFSEFSHLFPGLCEGKSTLVPSCMSQPCLPVSNIGPTRILPHLYLGCQRDVLNKVPECPEVGTWLGSRLNAGLTHSVSLCRT